MSWCLALLIVIGPVVPIQNPLIDQYKSGDHLTRTRVMSDAVQGRIPATDEQIRELLELAMRDSDRQVRYHAVGTVTSILQLSLMPGLPPSQNWALRLAQVGESLRGRLEELTSDPDPLVRHRALNGVLASAHQFKTGEPPPLAIARRLASVYESDPAAPIRTFAVQGLRYGHRSQDPEVRSLSRRVLLRALEESDEFVLQAAGWSALEAKATEALPLVLKQLQHPSHIARMGMAVALQGYGPEASAHLPLIEQTLAREPEGPTKETLRPRSRRSAAADLIPACPPSARRRTADR
jgi:HEAT repeat protein